MSSFLERPLDAWAGLERTPKQFGIVVPLYANISANTELADEGGPHATRVSLRACRRRPIGGAQRRSALRLCPR